MADRWTDANDREWRNRDWRRSEDDRRGGDRRFGEDRSWQGGGQEDRGRYAGRSSAYDWDDDYSSRMGVASGGAIHQSGRGGGSPRFSSQDYTGRQDQDPERDRGENPGRYGQGYRGDAGAYGRPRAYRSDRSDWNDDAVGFYEVEHFEARTWDIDDEDRFMDRDFGRRDREDRHVRDRDRDEDRYRAERRDHGRDRDREYERRRDEGRGEGASDFLHRAGERISSWFRGDNLMRGSHDEDGGERRYYRSDFGREARPLHRGMGPKGYQRSDERISDEVHQRLTDDPWIDASEIDVEVKSGEVTLSGHVDNREAKHRAERLIEDLSGVRHVQNNLRVNPQGLTSAGRGYGSSALEAEMRRNAQATDPGNNGVSGLSGRTSTGAAAERSSGGTQTGGKRT